MGGTIALRTAARHAVAGVAAVNPGLSFYDRRVRIVGLLKYFQRTTPPLQEENSTASATDDGDYSVTPLAAVHQLSRLFSATLRQLPAVRCPVLVFKSDTDAVVPPSSLELLRRRLGSRDLSVVRLPGSGHVATLDVDAPLLFEESARFFLQHARSTTPPAATSENP
jgi:carboxylesterase